MKQILVFAPCKQFADEPAFRVRILSLVEPMRKRGFEWVIHPRPKNLWGRLTLTKSAKDFHAVILHRQMLDPFEAKSLRRHLPHRRKILMDIDDATMLHEKALGTLARNRLDRRFRATSAILDHACPGNPYLASLFKAQNVHCHLIPSAVDPSRYPVKQHVQSKTLRLVWIGTASTLKYLELSFPALAATVDQVPGMQLVVICERMPANPPLKLPIQFIRWSLESETSSLQQGDIGISPLPENPWTLGKCGFKIVQFMAAGLPVVASPVGTNITLVNPGREDQTTGILPASWEQWPCAIHRLALDLPLRRQFGAAGRLRIETELCLDRVADSWAQLLDD